MKIQKSYFVVSFLTVLFSVSLAHAIDLNGRWDLYDTRCFSPEAKTCSTTIESLTLKVTYDPVELCLQSTFNQGSVPTDVCYKSFEKRTKSETIRLDLSLLSDGRSLAYVWKKKTSDMQVHRTISYTMSPNNKNYMRVYEVIRQYRYYPEFKEWRELFKPWRMEYFYRR